MQSTKINFVAESTILACEEHFGTAPERFRVFLGKSDSALSFGHVASILSCKYTIHGISEMDSELDSRTGIIFGAGTLPLRGHLDLRKVRKDIEILSDILSLETRPEPSYRILLEMMQPDLLQAGTAGDCMDEEISQLVVKPLLQWEK